MIVGCSSGQKGTEVGRRLQVAETRRDTEVVVAAAVAVEGVPDIVAEAVEPGPAEPAAGETQNPNTQESSSAREATEYWALGTATPAVEIGARRQAG
jgi:hypothetical protein